MNGSGRVDGLRLGDRVAAGRRGKIRGALEFDMHGRVEQRAGESVAGVEAMTLRVRW